MHTNIKKIAKVMEGIAPSHYAESWDNVGLLVGDENKMVENILLALEVTDEVINEAINKNVDLIITHHPLIFKPLKKITTNDPISRMVLKMIQNNINLFSAHTNLDTSEVGTCSYLADLIDVERRDYLTKTISDQLYKVQTFVPRDHLDKVKDAMTQAGAGQIGDYDSCTFDTEGTGQFRPNDQAHPFIGQAGDLEKVEETKIEAVVSSNISKVITALIKAHPYEEPAYDIIKLENKINEKGIGIKGFIKRKTLKELAEDLKLKLAADMVKIIGDSDKKISSVAIVTGAGADYFKAASKHVDVLITGDIKYHEAHMAKQLNLNVIDAGHFETENIYMPRLKIILDEIFEEKSYDVNVMVSETDINPFELI